VSAAPALPAPRKILIVDDDISRSHIYGRWLKDGRWLKLDGLTVEITDDGVGFLRRLRAHDGLRDIPVAVATGELVMDESVAKELKSLGAQISYKPLTAEEIVVARNLGEVSH
jgi:hypothetical protein